MIFSKHNRMQEKYSKREFVVDVNWISLKIIFNFCNKLSSKSQRRARPAYNTFYSYLYCNVYLSLGIISLLRMKETIALLIHITIYNDNAIIND